MNAPDSPRAALPARVLRTLATVGLALAAMLLPALLVLGSSPATGTLFSDFLATGTGKTPTATVIAAVLVVLLGPALVVYVLRRKNWLTDKVLLAGWAVLLPTMIWLAWDDAAIRHPLPMDEFSPDFPRAAESYAVLMRYGSQSADAVAKAFLDRKLAIQFSGVKIAEAAKWRDFITSRRAALETDWATLGPERRWLAELAAFDRIGDRTVPSITADIPRFQVWRTLSQHTTARASLLALDGRGDDAVATLLPLLEASRKLEPSSRTLVRTMIARVVQRQAVEAAGFVLDQTPVSPELKARLAAALGPVGDTAGVRRVMLIEYAGYLAMFGEKQLGDVRPARALPALVRYPLHAFGALFFNPRATANRYGDFAHDLATLAEQRDLPGLTRRQEEFSRHFGPPLPPKNMGGRLLLATFVPAYNHIVKNYWDTEDQRAALAARLRD